MNVTEYLLAGKNTERSALAPLERDVSYGELSGLVAATARYLSERNVRAEDRVLLFAENSVFWVSAYLATLHIGAVAVPLSAIISNEELRFILRSTEPSHAFVSGLLRSRRAEALDGLKLTDEAEWKSVLDGSSKQDLPAQPVSLDSLAALMFTSGSTGKPRGVMVSHGNIRANTDSIIAALQLTESDRIMAVLPFHYCFGTSLLHTHLRTGGTVVIENRFLYPETVLRRMVETRCTGFAGVPSHFQILLRKSTIRSTQFPHLRYVQQAGGHLAPVFIRELSDAFAGKQIYVMYGQTEATARLTSLPPEYVLTKLGSIGKPIPGVELQLIRETGDAAGPGQIGEIVATGANVTLGYWKDEEETATVFRDGRLHTGDLATVDEDGFYFIVGRAKDFLKCGGRRVSCHLIEEKVLEYEGVLEAAVVGMPDEALGEAVKLYVVPSDFSKKGSLAEELRLHCKRRLPPAFQPKQINIVDQLPKNSTGKIMKSSLP